MSRIDTQRQLLWRDETMRGFMTTLAERFLLLVPLNESPGTRRILKLSYQQQFATPDLLGEVLSGGWRSAIRELALSMWGNKDRARRDALSKLTRSTFGLDRYPVKLETRSVFGPESYHVEVLAPEELVIEYACLERVRTVTNLATGEIRYDRSPVAEDFGTERAHLYESLYTGDRSKAAPASANEETSGGSSILIDFFIRPSFVRPPLFIGLLTCGMLLAGLILKAAGIAKR